MVLLSFPTLSWAESLETVKKTGLLLRNTSANEHGFLSEIIRKNSVPSGYIGIYSDSDFWGMRNDLSGKYILMNDISLDFSNVAPIGVYSTDPFLGVLDGNGFQITGTFSVKQAPERTNYYGLFGYNKGVIKNLSFQFSTFIVEQSGSSYLDGYYGSIAGYNDGTIENCINKSDASFSLSTSGTANDGYDARLYAGAFCGYNASSGNIRNCINIGQISSIASARAGYGSPYETLGGITGVNTGLVECCINRGSVKTRAENLIWSNNPSLMTGGIAGSNEASGQIVQCCNEGAVSSYGNKNTRSESGTVYCYDGGICGSTSSNCMISQCYNTGSVSSFGSVLATTNWSIYGTGTYVNTYTGGIVGGMRNSGGRIEESFNTASITVNANAQKPGGQHDTARNQMYAGGIAGSSSYVENCYNTGKIVVKCNCNSTSEKSSLYWGGVAGKATSVKTSYSAFECSYTAPVALPLDVFSGEISGNGTKSNCYAIDVPDLDDDVVYLLENELKDAENLPGFDFDEVWGISSVLNDGFPYIKALYDVYMANAVSVTVHLGEYSQYQGSVLKLSNTTKGTSASCFVTEKDTYTLSGNDHNGVYKLELCSQNGSVFGVVNEIIFEEGEHEKQVSFNSLLKSCSVDLILQNEEKEEITDGYSVEWYDENLNYLSSGSTIHGVAEGRTLHYSVRLKGGLSTQYVEPAALSSITIQDTGSHLCELQRIQTINVTGTVTDTDGNALGDTQIGFVQRISEASSNNVNVRTDSNGGFNAKIYNVATKMEAVKNDYFTYRWQGVPSDGQHFAVEMSELDGARIHLDVKKIGRDSNARDVSSFDNIDFRVTKNGTEIGTAVAQYPYLIIPFHELTDGCKLTIEATDRTGNFASANVDLNYSSSNDNRITITLYEKGCIKARLSNTTKCDGMALIFRSNGTQVESLFFSDSEVRSGALDAGRYQVVFMEKSELFSNLSSRSAMETLGLKNRVDYVLSTVDVVDGQVSEVLNVTIPKLNEDKFSYTNAEDTSVTTARSEVSFGQSVQLKATFALKEKYHNSFSNPALIITLSDNCEFIPNTLTVNALPSAEYSLEGKSLTIPMGEAADGIAKIYIRPLNAGEKVRIHAQLRFELSGDTITQPVGSSSVDVTQMDFYVPAKTGSKTNTVMGKTIANADVSIFDNGILVAQTVSNAVGSFSATYNLSEKKSYAAHKVYAEVVDSNGVSLVSQTETMIYDANNPALKKITMIGYGGSTAEFDFLNPSTVTPTYAYGIGLPQTITFMVSFTINDPKKVRNVHVFTNDGNGNITDVPAVYNESNGLWVGSHSYFSDLPRSVYATFENVSEQLAVMNEVTGTATNANVSVKDHLYTAKEYVLPESGTAFGLKEIYPNKGANGTVTVRITGDMLEANLVAKMVKGSTEIPASEIYYMSASTAYATFDFSSASNGEYTLRVSCTDQTAALYNCFIVDSSLPKGKLTSSLNVERALKAGTLYNGSVTLTNAGYTDVYAPLICLRGKNLLIGESEQSLDDSLVLYAASDNGLGGTLLAGESTGFNFTYRSEETGEYVLKLLDAGELDYQIFGSTGLTSDSSSVEILTENWISLAGEKSEEYAKKLAKMANYLSQFGTDPLDLDTLKNAWSSSANASLLGETLLSATDLSSMDLSFSRSFLTNIAKRSVKGIFGKGWATNYEITARHETVDDENFIVVSNPTDVQVFKETEGQYKEVFYQQSTAAIADGCITVTNRDGSVLAFDADGKLSSIADLCGNGQTFTYTDGRLTAITSTNGDRIVLTYGDGKVVKAVCPTNGDEAIYTYSGDLLASVTTKYGTTVYNYDDVSIGGKRGTLISATYPDESSIHFEYDELGRLTRQYANEGDEAITYAYGPCNEVTVTDALGNETRLFYNVVGLLARSISAAGETVEYTYTDLLLPETTVYGAALSSKNVYNERYDVTEIVDPNGQSVRCTYDDFGGLTSLTDQGGATTTYERNALGQTSRLIYADGSFESYTYDVKGNLKTATNRKGETTTYSYDAFSNPTNVAFADGTTITYVYDTRGNVTSLTENGETTTVAYDANGNMTCVTYPDGKIVAYGYDAVGRMTSLTDSEGYVTNYTYDSLGRLEKLTDRNGAVLTTYSYNADGSLKKQTNANGTNTAYGYEFGRLKSIRNFGADGELLSKFLYTYDRFGLIDTMTDNSGTWHYSYDKLGQLVSATSPAGKVTTYVYDASGNRTSVTEDGVKTAYTANSLNQYTACGSANLTYDANGNLISRTDGSGTTTYTYDNRDRLVRVTAPGSVTEYGYDAFGGRNSVTVNGTETTYVNSPLGYGYAVTSYSGGAATSYVLGDGITAQVIGGSTYFFNNNYLGSVSEITDGNGTPVNTYAYDQEGTVTARTEAIVNPFTYVGKYGIMEEANGLWYMRARYVSKETDGFITVDPIGQNSDINVYRYVNNSPTLSMDITGEDGISFNNLNYIDPMNDTSSRVFKIRSAESAAYNVAKKKTLQQGESIFLKEAGKKKAYANINVLIAITIVIAVVAMIRPTVAKQYRDRAVNTIKTDPKARGELVGQLLGLPLGGIPSILFGALLGKHMDRSLDWWADLFNKLLNPDGENPYKNINWPEETKPIDGKENNNPNGVGTPSAMPTVPRGVPTVGKIDPSGYVCEAVASNRLEGVTATIFYKESENATESYVWDASTHDQENPLITDQYGYYEWFVPTAWWQVRYEKDGYVTGYSDWLPVPPPQTDVNISLTSMRAPKVESVCAYEDAVELTFSQYMDLSAVNTKNVQISTGNQILTGELLPLDAEPSFNNSKISYARTFRFVPEATLTIGQTVDVTAFHVKNYAGTEIDEAYGTSVSVQVRPTEIVAQPELTMDVGETKTVAIQVLPAAAGKNRKIHATSDNPLIAATDNEDLLAGADGTAVMAVTALLPGSANLTLKVEGTTLVTQVNVTVNNPVEQIETFTITVESDTQKCSVSGAGQYPLGETVELQAVPSKGYTFLGWYENGVLVSKENPYTYYVKDDLNLIAKFDGHKHHYVASVTTPSTCTEPGVRTYTCDICDDSYTESIPALGHIDEANDGYCDRCGQMMVGDGYCPQCGKIHNEPIIGWLIALFHRIIYRLTHLFQPAV